MAVTSTIELTTRRTIKDIYPGVESYRTRQRLYNWVSLGDNRYVSYSSGRVTELFRDGRKLLNMADEVIGTTDATTTTAILDGMADEDTVNFNSVALTSDADFPAGTFAIISATERLFITDATSDVITVLRGMGGTPTNERASGTSIVTLMRPDEDGQWYQIINTSNEVEFEDFVVLYSTSNPNDVIMESGEDTETLMTRMIRRASRMVESLLDSRQAREIVKDREGNYPEFIQRAVGLKAIIMLLKANDPESPVIESFEEEFNDIIEGYRSGNIQLPGAVTTDSSKGVIREVSVNDDSDLRLVELKGSYNSVGFDLIKVKVITGGVIGTATYSVWVKGNDKLKDNQVITAEKITGDYDLITYNLYALWAGDDYETAIVTADDEWEISVRGIDCDVSTSQVGSISLTRR